MKSLFIEKVAKMESPVFLSYNKKNALLTELVSLANAETVNVHSLEYMKVSEIIACYEKITGGKLSKTYIKTHKREDFVALVEAAYDYEGAAYEDDCDEMEAEGIGPDVNDTVVEKELPLLSEETARRLLNKLINHASNNVVKSFINKKIVNSVILQELTGKGLANHKLSEFSKEDIQKASIVKRELVDLALQPYKSGFKIKTAVLAGAYKNSLIKYRVKNNTIYVLNTRDKIITNMATGEIVNATKKNCAYFDNADLVGIDKIAC